MTTTLRRPQFERDGFIAVAGFLHEEEVAACVQELDSFIEHLVPELPPEDVFYEDREDRTTLKQLQRLHEHSPWFNSFMNGKPRTLAEELLGSEVTPQNMQYFNKPPTSAYALACDFNCQDLDNGNGNFELWKARSPLYQRQILQVNIHFSAFFEIYQIHIPSHRCKFKICRGIFCIFRQNFRGFPRFC